MRYDALADRALATIPVVLGTLATAGLVHFGTVLAYPKEVDDDAYARVAALAPVGVKTELPAADHARLPFRDAAMTAVVCRFDLGAGPFRIIVPALAQGFVSIALYDRRGRAFSGLDLHDDAGSDTILTVLRPDQKTGADASADEDGMLPVIAPGRLGFALVETPADTAAALDAVTCAPA